MSGRFSEFVCLLGHQGGHSGTRLAPQSDFLKLSSKPRPWEAMSWPFFAAPFARPPHVLIKPKGRDSQNTKACIATSWVGGRGNSNVP